MRLSRVICLVARCDKKDQNREAFIVTNDASEEYSGRETRCQNRILQDEVYLQIMRRYADRLRTFVRAHLSQSLRQKEGTSDVVLNVFDSLFKKDLDFTDPTSFGTELLLTMTRNKIVNVVNKYYGVTRDCRRERSTSFLQADGSEITRADLQILASGPSPEDAAAVIETVKTLCTRDQQVVSLRLEGHTYGEIATKLQCAERTVRRVINGLRQKWEHME